MQIQASSIKDVFTIEPRIFEDDRGYFFESFNEALFSEITGIDTRFIQDNESYSSKGVLRGLHFQKPPFAQSKLVRASYGEIIDVVVDLRKSSPSYGQWERFILSGTNKRQLFVPKGFAHGFIVTSEAAIVNYKVDAPYTPESDSGIYAFDKTLDIDWQILPDQALLSNKDKALPLFEEVDKLLIFD